MPIKPKKCKNCGEKFTPYRSTLETACSINCAVEFGKNNPKKINYEKVKREQLEGLETKKQTYVKKVNVVKLQFQKWIRNRDINEPCISCGAVVANEWHAGHFYKAENFSGLIFDERNCHKQCKKCNVFLDGNQLEYNNNLRLKYGIEWMEQLRLDAYMTKVKTYTEIELNEFKQKYK